MNFSTVSVDSLRCIEKLDVELIPGINVIVGRNGSGKTTFLEALGFVSFGRSFSSAPARDIVRDGCSAARVLATLQYDRSENLKVQVLRSLGGTKITLNGKVVRSASELAQRVPIILLNSKVSDILTSGPHSRRTLLDRVMFHVERGYVDLWRDYRSALMQRNSVIRSTKDPSQARFWTERLAESGEQINARRQEIVMVVNESLDNSVLSSELGKLTLVYEPGWRGGSLLDELNYSWNRDLELGYSRVGAHRADVRLLRASKIASQRLSRGQLKAVASEIMLSLSGFIKKKTRISPVIMVDDLQAELDDVTRAFVVDKILGEGGQKFFTAITPLSIPEVFEKADKVFHVEQLTRSV